MLVERHQPVSTYPELVIVAVAVRFRELTIL